MRFFYTPKWLQRWQSVYTWRIDNACKHIFLTFDDGPIPEVTPFVLDTLKAYQAKATFFCVGDNIQKHPQVFERVIAEGHTVANHTFNHLNGWKTEDTTYLQNIEACASCLPAGNTLFRPPYGKVKKSQLEVIKLTHQIIMWDVLSYDFDATLSPETCLRKTQKYTREGSIIVFHDSLKAENNLKYVLPRYMDWAVGKGFIFSALP